MAWIYAQVFAQCQREHPALRGGAEQALHILQAQAAVVQGALNALGHEVQRRHATGHFAQVGFRHPDDGAAAAFHGASPASSNSGRGASSPAWGTMRARTLMPIRTSSGAIPSTRDIMRKPSSTSISATL